MTLQELGWNQDFECEWPAYQKTGLVPARLVRESPINYGALLAEGEEIDVICSGRVWHGAENDADLPAVGDWVAVEVGDENTDHVIRGRLPRRTCFSRKMPGNRSQAQVIAANVDVVAVVTDAGPDFNPRRMERYFTLIEKSGAKPVVFVNKADLFTEGENHDAADRIERLCESADVHITSALRGEGLRVLQNYLLPGVTMCMVGSSGVGKSTLVNQLCGEDWQWTGEVNQSTGKGRHTTTSRELVPLKNGGLLIDNPGMREIQMWTDEETLRESFSDVTALAAQCRFSDCSHRGEPGCAVLEAVENGQLDPDRYQSFLRLEEEIANLQIRAEKRRITCERRAKRSHRVKARNLNDRIQLEKDERGEV